MKRIIVGSVILLSLGIQLDTNPLIVSSTPGRYPVSYFAVRPQFQVGSPEYLSLTHYNPQEECGSSFLTGWYFDAVPLGGKSTKPNKLAEYFSPSEGPTVIVDGTIAENGEFALTQHFNLFSVRFSPSTASAIGLNNNNIANPFRSKIIFSPSQSVAGLGLSARKEFYFGSHPFWAQISGPLLHVRNTMGLQEVIEQPGQFYNVQPIPGQTTNLNKQLRSMEEALVQDCWQFGKIDNRKHKKTKFAFLQAQLGMHVEYCEPCYFAPFVGITIPTGNTPEAEFLFEPIVGNGNHFGFFWGSTARVNVVDSVPHDAVMDFKADVVMQYLLKKRQKRSIDLVNKQWSRYIEVYESRAQANQAFALFQAGGLDNLLRSIFLASPGINFLTRDVDVRPGFSFTSNLALVLDFHPYDAGFCAEAGYNFYARQAERISLRNALPSELAIKDHIGRGLTNPVRNLTNDLLTNEASLTNIVFNGGNIDSPATIQAAYDRGIIAASDLDLTTAEHPCMLSHTVYGTFGYHWLDWCYPITAGVGVSYEFSRIACPGMDRWLVWGKFGINF
jgi:hypothetical protein